MKSLSSSAPGGAMPKPSANLLLALLPPADLQRWRPQLGTVDMSAGQSLRHGGEHDGHVYFPTTASVSMQHVTYSGDSLEVVAIGNEGMVGLGALLGGGSIFGDAVVRGAGQAFRVGSAWIQSEFRANAAVKGVLLRYVHAVMAHTAQSAMCNNYHSLEQRLCRCLLRGLDCATGATLRLTHESLACMLGARRAGVTCAALELQRAGVIDYARGSVVVKDRAGLEERSCECYRKIKAVYRDIRAPAAPERARQRAAPVPQALARMPVSNAGWAPAV